MGGSPGSVFPLGWPSVGERDTTTSGPVVVQRDIAFAVSALAEARTGPTRVLSEQRVKCLLVRDIQQRTGASLTVELCFNNALDLCLGERSRPNKGSMETRDMIVAYFDIGSLVCRIPCDNQ